MVLTTFVHPCVSPRFCNPYCLTRGFLDSLHRHRGFFGSPCGPYLSRDFTRRRHAQVALWLPARDPAPLYVPLHSIAPRAGPSVWLRRIQQHSQSLHVPVLAGRERGRGGQGAT